MKRSTFVVAATAVFVLGAVAAPTFVAPTLAHAQSKDDLEKCWELGATVAAGLMEG